MGWHTMYSMILYDVTLLVATCLLPRIREFIHARPKAKCGIAVLSMDKFPYPRKQTGVTILYHAHTYGIDLKFLNRVKN